MNHAEEMNKMIALAAGRPDFEAQGFRHYESESQASLKKASQASNLFFTCSVLGMEAVSHVIEDQAVTLGGQFRFYSAFQKFSRFKPQEERYQRILSLNNPVYIFGIPDVPLTTTSNLYPVELEKPTTPDETNLSHNWFVVLHNPHFVSMALVAQEFPSETRSVPAGASQKLVYRNFEGFWTYDREVISQVVTILDDYIAHAEPAVPSLS